jgi:hypothetical protein
MISRFIIHSFTASSFETTILLLVLLQLSCRDNSILLIETFKVMTRKIPPHIARELARHVKQLRPTSSGANSTASRATQMNNETSNFNSKIKTVIGCFAFVSVTASIPFLAMKWIGPLNEKDGALSSAQIRRGAFNNSGSRDVGKDPHWDFKTGRRKKDKDYEDLFLKDNAEDIDHGDRYLHISKRNR